MRSPLRLLLIATTLSVALTASPASAKSVCACADKDDLLNRLNEAEHAILEYTFQITVIAQQELDQNKKILLTMNSYNALQDRIKDVVNTVTNGAANHGTAVTDQLNCKTTVKPTTPCLTEILNDVHEVIHRDACNSTGRASKALTSVPLIEMAREEIRAYTAERDYILSVLETLPCRPTKWFGTISYSINRKIDDSSEFPPRNNGMTETIGGTSTSKAATNAVGVVWILDDVGHATETLNDEWEASKNYQQLVMCGSKRGKEAASTTSVEKRTGSATTSDKSQVSVSIRKSGASVTFVTLDHKITSTTTMSTTQSGPCLKPHTDPPPNTSTSSMRLIGSITVPSTLSEDGLSLTGDFSGFQSPPVATQAKKPGDWNSSSETSLKARVSLHRFVAASP